MSVPRFDKFEGELPEEISLEELPRYMKNRRWGLQEKENGEHRTIIKNGYVVRDLNRMGDVGKGLPKHIIEAFRRHPLKSFVVEGELVLDRNFFIFEALVLEDEILVNDTYEYRESRFHEEFDRFDKHIIPVETVRDEECKKRLLLDVARRRGEGVIIRDMEAVVKPGRSGQHKKFKLWKTIDAVVIGPSPEGKNSVRVGVYDERGRLQELCGVTLKKYRLNPNDVVQVRYLYGTRDKDTGVRKAVQPNLLLQGRARDDKRPRECTISQLVINKNFDA